MECAPSAMAGQWTMPRYLARLEEADPGEMFEELRQMRRLLGGQPDADLEVVGESLSGHVRRPQVADAAVGHSELGVQQHVASARGQGLERQDRRVAPFADDVGDGPTQCRERL